MKGMSLIVKTITRLVVGFILIFGVAVVLYGHLTPGGGFAGGVILSCALILTLLAFGGEFASRLMDEHSAAVWDCIGAFAFLVVALLGYLGGRFFLNLKALRDDEPFRLFSSGSILFSNVAIGIKVAVCLFGVMMALAAFRLVQKSKEGG